MRLTSEQTTRILKLKEENFFTFASSEACFCCEGTRFRSLLEKDRYGFPLNYVRCLDCGYIFANPYYSDDCLSRFYSEHYATVYGKQGSAPLLFQSEFINSYESIWPLVKPYAPQEGAVLDYGCAHGGSLMAFPAHWKRVGYDYDEKQMEYGRRFGLDLRDIRDIANCREAFDVVMLNQVLEHTINSLDMLNSVRAFLKEDGVLYLEVPSLDKIWKSSEPVLAFKNAHRHFFCIDSVVRIASRAGLTLLFAEERVSRFHGKRDALRAVLRLASCASRPSPGAYTSGAVWADRIEAALRHPPRHAPYLEAAALPFRVLKKIRRKYAVARMIKASGQ